MSIRGLNVEKKNQAIFSENLPVPKYSYFRQSKKGVTIRVSVTILGVTIIMIT